ncbi:hypothetical protein [Thalassotalea sp. G2M2-11]|uniref:hypothetical protein n=1 Tax=Thalassotalea sp. G2M2-11 TaxID=2787627 RepID=UPI0019D1370D|nr:hypothetical protein [Thalassotalea sp. G2M2-11]
MNILHKWIILACLLLAALISYGYGLSQSAAFFVFLGMVLELTFWFGIFGQRKQYHDKPHR